MKFKVGDYVTPIENLFGRLYGKMKITAINSVDKVAYCKPEDDTNAYEFELDRLKYFVKKNFDSFEQYYNEMAE